MRAKQAWGPELDPQAPGQKPGHSNMCLESQQWGGRGRDLLTRESTYIVQLWLPHMCTNKTCTNNKKKVASLSLITMVSTLLLKETLIRQMTPNSQRQNWQEFLGL